MLAVLEVEISLCFGGGGGGGGGGTENSQNACLSSAHMCNNYNNVCYKMCNSSLALQ